MPQEPTDPWQIEFVFAVALTSILTWLFLLGRSRRWPILSYEPREPVPWGFAGGCLALIFLTTKISELFTNPSSEISVPSVSEMAAGMLLQVMVVGLFLLGVVALAGANARDLGVDSFWRRAGRDIRIGIVTCLAAFVPVFAVQMLVVSLLGEPTQHPLVTMVEKNPDWTTLAFMFVTAVIVAPICEEVTFRLLLQGWLEKWEDEKLGRPRTATPEVIDSTVELVAAEVEPVTAGPSINGSPAVLDVAVEMTETRPTAGPWQPPQGGLFGLPHGWAPILLSSLAFALAHVGHGTDPIPLFVLAIILGYVYQRTHRLLPSIITHAMFNLATAILLWRVVVHAGQ